MRSSEAAAVCPCPLIRQGLALLFAGLLMVQAVAHPDLEVQIEALSAQLETQPRDAELLLRRGDLHRRHEDFDAARRDFAAARQSDPNHPWLDLYEGRVDLESGNPSSALALLGNFLEANPDHAMAWHLHGETLCTVGRFEEAATSFARAIEHSAAPSPDLFRLRTLSWLTLGEAGYVRASEVVDAGLAHFGSEITLLGLGVDIALANGRLERAAMLLNAAPHGLAKLPDWAERRELLECLPTSASCQERARARLEHVIETFRAECAEHLG